MKKNILLGILVVSTIYLQSQTLTPVTINGVFNTYIETIIDSINQQQTRNSALAYFSEAPVLVITQQDFKHAGQVSLNGKKLQLKGPDKYYASHIKVNNSDPDLGVDECNNTTPNTPMHWTVTGHSNIPAMNFIYNSPYPSFNSILPLPSLLKKTDTLFFNVTGLTGADSVYISVYDSFFNDANRKYLKFAFGYNSITTLYGSKILYIVPSLLSSLSEGSKSLIKIEAVKKNYQTIGGKNYLFNTYTTQMKPSITIIN